MSIIRGNAPLISIDQRKARINRYRSKLHWQRRMYHLIYILSGPQTARTMASIHMDYLPQIKWRLRHQLLPKIRSLLKG